MAHTDSWALLARISAHPRLFSAAESVADTTAQLLLRQQLMLGVRATKDLSAISDAVGPDAMARAVRALAPYEVRRILDNIDPVICATSASPDEARRRLADLASVGLEPNGDPPRSSFTGGAHLPSPSLRGHRALGARRIRMDAKP